MVEAALKLLQGLGLKIGFVNYDAPSSQYGFGWKVMIKAAIADVGRLFHPIHADSAIVVLHEKKGGSIRRFAARVGRGHSVGVIRVLM
jgi:hypothetical protein